MSLVPSTSEFVNPGQPLPETVRHRMESSLGEDLSGIRLHHGHHAGAMGALAYTEGQNIYFQPGHGDPHTPEGSELLGHEVTHVIQQREGRVAVQDDGDDE
jgi:Domain of unknown function (DUF4157)